MRGMRDGRIPQTQLAGDKLLSYIYCTRSSGITQKNHGIFVIEERSTSYTVYRDPESLSSLSTSAEGVLEEC